MSFIYYFVAIFALICNLQADVQEEKNKIYIDIERIAIDEKNIYIINEGKLCPVEALYSDENGFYIYLGGRDRISDTCLNGHQIYHWACGGCANWWCHFRCKCHSPWN